MRLHILLLIVSVVLIGITGIFVTRHSGAQEQNQQAYDIACDVFDVASLKDCVQKAKNKEVDLIKISKIVECSSKEDCAVDFSNMGKGIKIYGINNGATGFRRTGNFDYSIFTITNTKDFVIGSFLIDDSSDGDCAALGSSCPPAILISNAANTTVDLLKTMNVKNNALVVEASSGITIKNSVFENSGNHSVVVRNGTSPSQNITVDTNTFSGSSSNAVVFAAAGSGNVMQNNIFDGNHTQPLYDGCTGICVGAQLRIMPNTGSLLIQKNVIRNGTIATYGALGLYASGIEISGGNVESVTLSCNKIYSNTGNGVVVPNRTSSTQQVIMKQNAIFSNGINTNVVVGPSDQIENNCFDIGCTVSGC